MIRSSIVVLALTGGIGAGKSTVASMFAARGAVVVDTDMIAREVVEPGEPAYRAVVDRFGTAVLEGGADGAPVDRRRLADLVFSDAEARAGLNAIVHPAVEAAVGERLRAEAGTDHVVVVVVPLLVEAGWDHHADAVVVVDCPEEVAVRRLVETRGMVEPDARRRIAAQASRAERLAHADAVIMNAGSLEDLARRVDEAWATLAVPARGGS